MVCRRQSRLACAHIALIPAITGVGGSAGGYAALAVNRPAVGLQPAAAISADASINRSLYLPCIVAGVRRFERRPASPPPIGPRNQAQRRVSSAAALGRPRG